MTDTPMTPTDHLLIHEHAETAYLQYAMTTVKDRALAQVQDGQKPVQRRILFALHQLGLRADVKPVKSARIVGDVLGKYHPHGDTAAYDAMVRMAQPFMLRYPLVDGQGNFGSPDGDSAAAMRYTEARLAPFAQLLLAEVDQDTVDFRPNYDGAFQEPVLLPARLPILLANGTLGVAVGMASSVPSHNLGELATAAALVVANPAARLDEVLALMPAPDFPGGGQLISSAADMRETYESGRGSFRVRARWSIEELARGQYQIVVTELPYQVSARQVLEQIEVLSNPQPAAGKKAATPAQLTLRAALLELLEKAVDESSQSSPVRLVLVPRTSKVDATLLMDFLFANTALEAGFSLNLTFIGANGRPQQRGLMDVLTQWADFRMETVRRRTAHELAKNEARSHILAGRLIAFDAIEAVVRVIREADDPATELKAKFGLSDIQAADILEMRLRALNRLEGVKLTEELDALKTRAKALRLLLADESALRALVVAEIEADGKTFGDERRTLVEEAEAVTLKAGRKAAAMTLADEPVTVTLSKNLLIKTRNGHVTDPSSLAWRAGDGPLAIVAARSTWPLIVLDDTGRAYTVSISDLPGGRGDGVPLTSLIELTPGARIVTAFSGEPDSRWLLAGARGYGFVIPLAKAMATRRAGKALLTVQPKEPILPPIALKASDTTIAVLSSSDRVLVFGANELKTLPNGGQGTQLMALNDDERVIMLVAGNEAGFAVKAKGKELKLVGEALERYAGKRARRGGKLPGPGSALRALGNADA